MQDDIQQKTIFKWLLGYLPAVLCISLIAIASINFYSLYTAHSPRLSLEEWSCYGKMVSEEAWDESLYKLTKARKLNPWDAEIDFDLGRLYEWKALSGQAWNKAVKDSRNESIKYFRSAVEKRPTWGLAWVNLAQSKLLNRVVDEELFNALSNTIRYGRWQQKIQEKYLWLSIGIWAKLPPSLQKEIFEHIEGILQRDAELKQHAALSMLTSIAVRFNWFNQLEPRTFNQKQLDYIRYVKTSPEQKKQMLGGGAGGGGKPPQFICEVGI